MFTQYEPLKNLHDKLTAKLDHTFQEVDQPQIYFHDIFVYAENQKESYGECKNFRQEKYKMLSTYDRLIAQVNLLATTANEYHKQYYCHQNHEGTYDIKNDSTPKITRILLSEFSLYPIEPFNMKDFKKILAEIETIASKQMKNVHLLLSSLPVLSKEGYNTIILLKSSDHFPLKMKPNVLYLYKDTNNIVHVFSSHTSPFKLKKSISNLLSDTLAKSNYLFNCNAEQTIVSPGLIHQLLSLTKCHPMQQILNMTLYVQCGPQPRINTICKAHRSQVDISYKNLSPFNQTNLLLEQKTIKSTPQFFSAFQGAPISTSAIFQVRLDESPNSPFYFQAVDVCQSHYFKHSKEQLKIMFQRKVSTDTTFFPNLVDHIVTSNSIKITESAKLSDNIIHIDTVHDKAKIDDTDRMTLFYLTHSDGMKTLNKEYPHLTIHKLEEYNSITLLKDKKSLPQSLSVGTVYLWRNTDNIISIFSVKENEKKLSKNQSAKLVVLIRKKGYQFDNANVMDSTLLAFVCPKGFYFENPPFGANFSIVPTIERKITGFTNELVGVVQKRNEELKNHLIQSRLQNDSRFMEIDILISIVENLYQTLRNFYILSDHSNEENQIQKYQYIIHHSFNHFTHLQNNKLELAFGIEKHLINLINNLNNTYDPTHSLTPPKELTELISFFIKLIKNSDQVDNVVLPEQPIKRLRK